MENLELKLAYLAGLFDGEGTVTLTMESNRLRNRYPVLSMSSTTYNLLEICKTHFGGHISTHKVYKQHHKQSWSWKVANNSALYAAELLLPYIQEPEKKRRLQLLVSKYKLVTKRNGKYSDQELMLKRNFETNFFHPSNSVVIP